MTPAQRQYDTDLAAAMRETARLVEPRSRKMSDMLKVAAGRIEALTALIPIQPASTPDEAQPNR